MPPLRVAIQGERGSFSHEASLGALGEHIEIVACATFDQLFEAVAGGGADRAVVPIENSLHGSIHENYDRLSARALHITGEVQLRVKQCLIARPGATLASLRKVASHPVALAQCRLFLAEHPEIEAVVAYDTAGSVKDLLRDGPMTQAAIASALAARIYGAQLLLEGIEDDPQNFTRFLVLSRTPGPPDAATKTSLVFTLKNEPGILHRALGAFALRGVDLAKIESRPLRGRPWEYLFYLDVLGRPDGPAREALDELQGLAAELRVLGSYPGGLTRT
jgi:prephenate dehydratase